MEEGQVEEGVVEDGVVKEDVVEVDVDVVREDEVDKRRAAEGEFHHRPFKYQVYADQGLRNSRPHPPLPTPHTPPHPGVFEI